MTCVVLRTKHHDLNVPWGGRWSWSADQCQPGLLRDMSDEAHPVRCFHMSAKRLGLRSKSWRDEEVSELYDSHIVPVCVWLEISHQPGVIWCVALAEDNQSNGAPLVVRQLPHEFVQQVPIDDPGYGKFARHFSHVADAKHDGWVDLRLSSFTKRQAPAYHGYSSPAAYHRYYAPSFEDDYNNEYIPLKGSAQKKHAQLKKEIEVKTAAQEAGYDPDCCPGQPAKKRRVLIDQKEQSARLERPTSPG